MRWIGKHHAERTRPDVCEFEVIGELRSDPRHLLLRGCDGHFYSMDPSIGHLEQLEAEDSWSMEVTENTSRRIDLPRDTIV